MCRPHCMPVQPGLRNGHVFDLWEGARGPEHNPAHRTVEEADLQRYAAKHRGIGVSPKSPWQLFARAPP